MLPLTRTASVAGEGPPCSFLSVRNSCLEERPNLPDHELAALVVPERHVLEPAWFVAGLAPDSEPALDDLLDSVAGEPANADLQIVAGFVVELDIVLLGPLDKAFVARSRGP